MPYYNRYSYRRKSFKKKSLLSKINNLSYDGLLSWEIAYKNRINQIENNLNIKEFKKKTEELKKILKTLPNENILANEVAEYRSNFSMTIKRFIKKKFWSSDEGLKLGNLECKDENKMDEILKKIKNAKEKWSLVIPYDVYFCSLINEINKSRKELEIEKDIPTFIHDRYNTGGGGFASHKLFNSFYRKTSLYHSDSSEMSLTNELHNIQKKPVTLEGYVSDASKWVSCSQADLKGIDTRNSFYLVGDFWKKLIEIGIHSITNPNIPNQEDIVKYKNFILEKANSHLRKIQLRIRSKKRSVELGTNLNSVYIMSSEDLPKDSYKIGWTSMLPEERAEDLSGTSVLHDYKVEYSKKFKDAEKVEKQIHKHFSEFRIKKNKEVFNVKFEKIKEYIESIK